MIHQAPAGARDLLPLEVAQKCWINDRLQAVFKQWGYQRIVTSTIERLDTLMAGGAIDPATVIKLQDGKEGTLGLRPELTASIARTAVTRMNNGHNEPSRICYRANVFRNPPKGHHGRQLEFYQAGVELLFTGGVLADAEIILLLAACLSQLGINQWHLILGEASLTRLLLEPFPINIKDQVRLAIANLDRITLENLDLSTELRERALFLFDLRGKPADVLQKVASLPLETSALEKVNNLKSLMELLEATSPQPLPIILDLSLLQTFDYYTGIVFEAVSFPNNQPHILGRGGRYDQLLGVYHPQRITAPGIGFSVNIEDLYVSLLSTSGLPQQTPISDWLIIAKNPQAYAHAFIYAQQLRNADHSVRVEMDLGVNSPAEIREYARHHQIHNLAWVDVDGNTAIEKMIKD